MVVRCEDCGCEAYPKPGGALVCERCAEERLIVRFVALYEVALREVRMRVERHAADTMNLIKADYLIGQPIPEDLAGVPGWLRAYAAKQRRVAAEHGRDAEWALRLEGRAEWIEAWLARRTCDDCGAELDWRPPAPRVCPSCGELRMLARFPDLDRALETEAVQPVVNVLATAYVKGERVPDRIEDLPGWLRRKAASSREGVRRFEEEWGVRVLWPVHPSLALAARRLDHWLAGRRRG
jgi:hypothetical protein